MNGTWRSCALRPRTPTLRRCRRLAAPASQRGTSAASGMLLAPLASVYTTVAFDDSLASAMALQLGVGCGSGMPQACALALLSATPPAAQLPACVALIATSAKQIGMPSSPNVLNPEI